MILNVILYSKQKSQRISFNNIDEVVADEIEHTFLRECDVVNFRSGGARILASKQTRDALDVLVSKYDDVTKYHIRKLKGYISKLTDTDIFYYFNENKPNIVDRRTAIDFMLADTDSKLIHNKIFHYYSLMDIYYEYLSFGFDGLEQWVGEEDINKRVCRFCGKRMPKVKFGNDAHAVQEALGNKLLFCYEECDACNNKMAPIEDNFRVLMDFRRSMYHIPRKGKTKSPSIVGKNFVINPNAEGLPELYIMEEKIPSNTDRSQPFLMHFELKNPMVNEDMYKALCKMVIDMLPSKELEHFKQTINWINPDKNWMPDSLPSILTHYIPSDEIRYSQPVLDIYINNKGQLPESPYCTAVLYIYDMVYMFIMPMVDVDRGMFKYDKSLNVHWQRMAELLNIWKWAVQDSSNYRLSTAWINWDVDLSLPNVHVRLKDDAIFDECHKRKVLPIGVVFPAFRWNGIKMPKTINASFKCHYFKNVSVSDLIDITHHYLGPVFRIVPQFKQIFVKMSFEANDTTDSIKFFDVDFEVCIEAMSFDSYVSIETDEDGLTTSFAIDSVFCKNIYRLALFHANRDLESQRRGTPFETCRLDKLALDDRLFSNAYYLVPMGNRGVSIIYDRQIHHEGYYD
jgi:hypothetical protein